MTQKLYPGRLIRDSERTAFGLGWEYARRRWYVDHCPLKAAADLSDFMDGYHDFRCSDPKVDEPMLTRGVKM